MVLVQLAAPAPHALLRTWKAQPRSVFGSALSRLPPSLAAPMIVGASAMRAVTVTLETALPTLPSESWKRNVTGVVPAGNSVPVVTSTPAPPMIARAGNSVGAGSRTSTAVAAERNAASACDPAEPGTLPRAPRISVAGTEIGAGVITAGGIVSRTVTVKLAEAALPFASTAGHGTVVGAGNGEGEPDDGAQLTGTLPSTGSVAVATNENGAPVALVASSVALAGTTSVGGVVSVTVIVTLAVAGRTSTGSVGVNVAKSVRVPASSFV